MLQTVFNALFGCVHRRITFPRSHGRTPAGTPLWTYVACLDCGREIPYDWSRMKFGSPAALAAGTKERPGCEPPREPAGRAPRARHAIQAKNPPDARPPAALPTAPAFRPYLFAKSPAEAARASNGAQTAAAGDVRRCLARAGLRFRKLRVALRVLNSLMAGASLQPDDVALLVSWAGPDDRGRTAEQLARQVMEWAGSR